MLSMQRFCHAIKYRSVWHVDAMRRQGVAKSKRFLAECTSHCSEHVLFLRVESSLGQSAQRWKRLTDAVKVKQKCLTLRFECLLCLPFLRKVQTKREGSEEKQVILAVKA